MPQIVIINSANFSLLGVAQGTDASTLLLSYTQAPDAVNPATLTDALRPLNYTLTGPSVANIISVLQISSTMFQLSLDAPLITGTYTIAVTNVQASGAALNAPTSLIFQAYAALPLEPIQQGLENDDNPLRRWLPPQYRYKTAWEALIAALNYADAYVRENAYNAFDQLFLSSAIRPYLFQRAADYGVQYPSQVGMSDDLFRQLAIKSTAKKLVHQALLEILEVFYGEDSTRAVVLAGLNEPYILRAGDSISFLFDDREAVTVTFNADDFSNIAQATAGEVAAVMTRAFRAAGLAAYAASKPNAPGYAVKVYSGALGLLGSVQVTGGMAQNALQFPTRLPLFSAYPAIAPQWSGERISQDEFRFTWTRNYVPGDIIEVEIGDYVLLDFVNASLLRGSYEVTDVTFNVDPGTGNPNGLTWFSIAPTSGFPYILGDPPVTINQTSVDEIIFYKKVRQTVVQNINPSYIAQYADRGVDVIYPATTQAVDRGLTDAAYPHIADTVGGGIEEGGVATVSGTVGIPDVYVELASAPVTVLSTGGGAFTFTDVAAGDHVVTPITQPTVTIAPLSFSIAAGATQQMTATLHTATGTSDVTTTGSWGSGNTGVFTINSTTGLVTGVAAGTADVNFVYLGTWVQANISVTVYEAPVSGVNFTRTLIYAPPAAATVTVPVGAIDSVQVGVKIRYPIFTVGSGLLVIDPVVRPVLGDRLFECVRNTPSSELLPISHILGVDNVTMYPAYVNPADHTQIYVTGVTDEVEIFKNDGPYDYIRAIVPVTSPDNTAYDANVCLGPQHLITTTTNMEGDMLILNSAGGAVSHLAGTVMAVKWDDDLTIVDDFASGVTRDAVASTATRAVFYVTKTYGYYTARVRYDDGASNYLYGDKVFYGWDMA